MRPAVLFFLALAGYAANLVTLLVHELLGHGMTAVLLGGRIDDVFVTPLGGSANTGVDPALEPVVMASGALVTLAFGVAVWVWLRARMRSGRPTTPALDVVLWCIATEAVLDSLAYVAFQPAMGRMLGLESGDWLRLSGTWHLSPMLLLLVGLLVSVPVCGLLMEDARQIASVLLPRTRWRPLSAYWLLLLPGAVLLLAYFAAVSPWNDGPAAMALGNVLGVPLLGLAGALWLRWRSSASTDRRAERDRGITTRAAVTWGVALLAVAVAIAWTFGPASALRRGVLFGPPNADQYVAAAQRIDLELDLSQRGAPRLRATSSPLLDRGSPFRKRLTAELAPRGPSERAAMDLSRFIAEWNLDGAVVEAVTRPVSVNGAWTWDAELGPFPDSIMVRLWPLTWVTESYVSTLGVHGQGLEAIRPGTGGSRGDSLSWVRPQGMVAVDSFAVRLR